MIRSILSRLARAVRREEGNASVEFVIAVPAVLMIFMASVEAGWYMAKHVMMERGLDMVIREVRLGNLFVTGAPVLRTAICDATPILADCEAILRIEMRPVATDTFAMPDIPATCIDRSAPPPPDEDLDIGASNDLMMVRICAVQDPIFPTTGVGLRLRKDAMGGYQLATSSVYVNEPR